MSDTHDAFERRMKQILVVDDDISVREMLMRVLSDEGYTVWTAADGVEAIKVMGIVRFDLVLLDLSMPEKNGWDTFEALTRNDPLLAVIIITARPHQKPLAEVAGAFALLEKPLDFPELLQTVTESFTATSKFRAIRSGHAVSSVPSNREKL
jgi:CheY-like chemotaxis protein